MRKSQKQQILEYMQSGGRINKYSAFQKFGCMTLAQRIDDIEADIDNKLITGWELKREPDRLHNNAMVYWMDPLEDQFRLAV